MLQCLLASGKEKVTGTIEISHRNQKLFQTLLYLLPVKVMTVLHEVPAKGWDLELKLFMQVHYCFDLVFPEGNHCK